MQVRCTEGTRSGRPLAGCTVKIVDGSARELPTGTPGEIAALNHACPDFTYRNRPAERAALDRGGLVATGDIGYVDNDRFLFLCGRKDDMVISGGFNIFPAEVEAALLSLPGVRDCAVFGVPDAEYGQVLAANIEPAPGFELSEPDIRSQLNARLTRFKIPRVIRLDDALPRENTGKIFKKRLRDRYGSDAGRGT